MTALPLTAVILAREEGDDLVRSLTAVRGFAQEVIVIASHAPAERSLATDAPGTTVRRAPFRNAAEALHNLEAQHAWRLWLWAGEVPDKRAVASIAQAVSQDSGGPRAFSMVELFQGASVRSAPPGLPSVRLWRGPDSPLCTADTGLAEAITRIGTTRSPGHIVRSRSGDATRMIDNLEYEIGCAVHAAMDRTERHIPPRLGAIGLIGDWLAAWLRSGVASPTSRMVLTFLHHFWLPLLFNARLMEAGAEVEHAGPAVWLSQHARFAGGGG